MAEAWVSNQPMEVAMAKRLWVSLDVAIDTTSICVIDADGNVLREAVCPTDAKRVHREIVSLGCRRSGQIGLEAGIGTSLARGLRDLGYLVELYEARQLSKFLRVRRNKTDAGDALGIAHAGRIASPVVSRVYLKSLECQSLASRLKIRRYLDRVRLKAMTLVRRQLELFGIRIAPGSPATFTSRAEKHIKKTFDRTSNPLGGDLRNVLDFIDRLRAHKTALDRDLRALALSNDICRRMMKIPGVGPICALTFYAAVGEPQRFRKASDIGPYLGMTPRVHQSGRTSRSGRISRMGNAAVRGLLVQSSVHFMRSCDPRSRLRAWAATLEERRGKGKARVALARKLATIMLAMWKGGTTFDLRLVEVDG